MQCLSFLDSYECLFKIDHFFIQTGLELQTMFWRTDLLNMLRVYLLPLILLPLVSMASHLLKKLSFKGRYHHLTYSCLVPDDEAKSKRVLSSNGYHKFLWRINNSYSSESNSTVLEDWWPRKRSIEVWGNKWRQSWPILATCYIWQNLDNTLAELI